MLHFITALKMWIKLIQNKEDLVFRILASKRFFRVLEGKDPLESDYNHGQPWLWKPYSDPQSPCDCMEPCDYCYEGDLHLLSKYDMYI